MKSFRRHIKEASYEVKIQGLPDMYIDSKSPVTIKKQFRKQLRKPEDLVSKTKKLFTKYNNTVFGHNSN